MKHLEEINRVLARYGIEPITEEYILEVRASLSEITDDTYRSLERVWAKIRERESTGETKKICVN